MARQTRIEYPGAFYHVISRGIERRDLFRDDADRRRYLSLLEKAVARFGFRLHSYCLMSNHVHLAVETGNIPLSRIMRSINTAYAGYFNVRHRRTGYLFQGRYKAFLVDSESYLLALVRYIHENPIKARIAEEPAEYLWSSHSSYLTRAPKWLETDSVLRRFGGSRSRARRAFADFFAAGEDHPYEEATRYGQLVVGRESFADSVFQTHGEPPLVVRHLTPDRLAEWVAKREKVGLVRLRGKERTATVAQTRSLCGALAPSVGLSIAGLARYFNRTQSALWRQVQTYERRAASDPRSASALDRYRRAAAALANNT